MSYAMSPSPYRSVIDHHVFVGSVYQNDLVMVLGVELIDNTSEFCDVDDGSCWLTLVFFSEQNGPCLGRMRTHPRYWERIDEE